MSNSLRATLALVFGLLCLGFSAIFVSWANAPGATTGFYRMAVPVLVLAPLFVRRLRSHTSLPRREFLIAVFGGFFFAGDLLFWNTGVLIGGATNPTLLGNTAPIWVALGALLFFRERLSPAFWVGLLIAVAGAVIILGVDVDRGPAAGLGTLLASLPASFMVLTSWSRSAAGSGLTPDQLLARCRRRSSRAPCRCVSPPATADRLLLHNLSQLPRPGSRRPGRRPVRL